jgi:hypothetical protein
LFQAERFLLDHLRDSHRPKLASGTKRRLISGELVPGQSGVELECADLVNPPSSTELFFALGEFTAHSRVRATVVAAKRQLVLRIDRWEVEITGEYDWDPGTWALIPGFGGMTSEEMLALRMAGYGRPYPVRSDWATIADPAVIAPVTLPGGNY